MNDLPKNPNHGTDYITSAEERVFEEKAERMLAGHRGLQDGRDYRWNCFRFRDETDDFRSRFDQTFSGAPSSPEWYEKRYCSRCSKVHSLCNCE